MRPVLLEEKQSVEKDGKVMHLTPHEYSILEFLMAHPNEIFTADEIYENSWSEKPFHTNLIISVHIRHLREKIEVNPSNPQYIKASWGKGYRFVL